MLPWHHACSMRTPCVLYACSMRDCSSKLYVCATSEYLISLLLRECGVETIHCYSKYPYVKCVCVISRYPSIGRLVITGSVAVLALVLTWDYLIARWVQQPQRSTLAKFYRVRPSTTSVKLCLIPREHFQLD